MVELLKLFMPGRQLAVQVTQLQLALPQLLLVALQSLLPRHRFLLRLLQRLLQQPQLGFMLRIRLLHPQTGDQPPQQHADRYAANPINQTGIHPASCCTLPFRRFARPLPVTLRGACMDVQPDFARRAQYCAALRNLARNQPSHWLSHLMPNAPGARMPNARIIADVTLANWK